MALLVPNISINEWSVTDLLPRRCLSFDSCGPFNLPGLTSIPAWIGNYTHHKVWDEITYPFPNFNNAPLKFGNGYVISSHTLLGDYLFMLGSKLIHASKSRPCL